MTRIQLIAQVIYYIYKDLEDNVIGVIVAALAVAFIGLDARTKNARPRQIISLGS
jgi:hypothetical protein